MAITVTTLVWQRTSQEIDGPRSDSYLRIIITHRQQQTAQYPDIRVETGGSHIPNMIYCVHFRLF